MPRAARQSAAPPDLVELGRVVSAYGVRGWIKVQPHSPQADVLLSASRWWLAPPSREGRDASGAMAPQPLDITASRRQGAAIVAGLSGVGDRTAAEAWRGATVWVPRSAFPPPQEDEYYWVDLIGCLVHGDAEGVPVPIGRVTEVLDNGAHAILKVARLAPALPAVAGPGQGAGRSAPAAGLAADPAVAPVAAPAASPAAATGEPAGAASAAADPASLQPVLDAKGRPQEILIPFVAAHILRVDLDARRIDSNWPADF